MNHEEKHIQIAKALSRITPENLLESLSAIEYALISPGDSKKSLVPLEANFQLPNAFLKTKNSLEVDKLFAKSNSSGNWNKSIDIAIEMLESLEFPTIDTPVNGEFDQRILEEMIKWRYN